MRNYLLVLLLLIVGCANTNSRISLEKTPPAVGYEYTSDWVSDRVPEFQKTLKDFVGRKNIIYLEVGIFEGRSLFWMLDNVLTDPSSRAIGIDAFDLRSNESGENSWLTEIEKRFYRNLSFSRNEKRVRVLKQYSTDALRSLKPESIDIIYVDGDHRSKTVLEDAVQSWILLKDGGILIFDDYKLALDLIPDFLRPKVAIDSFMNAYNGYFEIIHKGYQIHLRKIQPKGEGFCPPKSCTRYGKFIYAWYEDSLYDNNHVSVKIVEAQKNKVRALFLRVENKDQTAFQELDRVLVKLKSSFK